MMNWLTSALSWVAAWDPRRLNLAVAIYLGAYFGLTHLFYQVHKKNIVTGWLRRNGPLDIVSSVGLILTMLVFLASAVATAAFSRPSFDILFADFVLYTILFAVLYSLLEWHLPNSFQGITLGTWACEAECLIFSLQTMTTLGYVTMKPATRTANLLACIQAALSLFFFAVFIGRWTNP